MNQRTQMYKSLIVSVVFLLAGCDVQSSITKRSVEKYGPTPTPSVSPTPVEEPIDPADVVTVDTSLQGENISVNKPGEKKTLNCDKYNQVMLNNVDAVITINGACRAIMVNGNNNDVTAETTMSVTFNGTGNTVRYAKYANGKRPFITDNKTGNRVEKIKAEPAK